ncbi:hypothetical protein, partial [Streptomyces sp. NPDC047968]|uniref:hypothetical protein n=1 Tax=Streptomyces sp. NPDC047968 TaxID=3155382 RepID=UPI0034295CB2
SWAAGPARRTGSTSAGIRREHAGQLVAQGITREVMAPGLLSQIYEVDFHLQWVGDQRWIMTRTA